MNSTIFKKTQENAMEPSSLKRLRDDDIDDDIDEFYEQRKRACGSSNDNNFAFCPLVISICDGSRQLWKLVIAMWMKQNIHQKVYPHPTFGTNASQYRVTIFSKDSRNKVECSQVPTKDDFVQLERLGFEYVLVLVEEEYVYICANFESHRHVLYPCEERYLTVAQLEEFIAAK